MEPNPYDAPQVADSPNEGNRFNWVSIAIMSIRVVVAILVVLFFLSLLLPA
jgi:hypothetical protein